MGPTIKAKSRDIAYAISATFLFDIITVILFPLIGRAIGLSDTGYAFSDAAGILATIVKLTRTLFIVPIVLIFSWVHAKKELTNEERTKIRIRDIFPWFILGFLAMIALRSMNLIPDTFVNPISNLSKFFMAMALAAIGLKTSFKDVSAVGPKPNGSRCYHRYIGCNYRLNCPSNYIKSTLE